MQVGEVDPGVAVLLLVALYPELKMVQVAGWGVPWCLHPLPPYASPPRPALGAPVVVLGSVVVAFLKC